MAVPLERSKDIFNETEKELWKWSFGWTFVSWTHVLFFPRLHVPKIEISYFTFRGTFEGVSK